MTLIYDWKRVVRYAISMRLAIAAGALSAGAAIMACFLQGASFLYFAAFMLISILASMAGFAAAVARVTAQPKMHLPKKAR